MYSPNRFRRASFLRLIFCIMLCCAINAQSVICYVDADPQYTSVRGDSWDTPIISLQDAIDRVAEAGGGEVWVKAGVYKPVGTNRSATFTIKPNVKLLGGFRGSETDKTQRNPKANRTVLSGDIGKTSDSDNCYHVVTGDSNGLLDGFIISKGNANSLAADGIGAGVLLPKGTRDFSIFNCTFEKNNASWQGGAIYAENSSLSLSNCMFFANSATSGAGLATKGKLTLKLLDSIFSSNFSLQTGGAVELQSDIDAYIERCSFMYNRTQGRGGALSAQIAGNRSAKIEIVDSRFDNNIAGESAGAILFRGTFQPVITRCSFTQNVGKQGAGAIGNESGVTAVIDECQFRKNKGMKGKTDIGNDEKSANAEERVIPDEPEPELIPVAEEKKEIPPPPKSPLPDVYVHLKPDAPVLLSSIVSDSAFNVLVLGDLTDSDFIENYQDIEETARAYTSSDVRFFYIYRYLAHPENNGYLQPFLILERARQAQLATQLLRTRIPWLLDTMDDQAAKALEDETGKDNVFIFSSDGTQLYSCSINDSTGFRKALNNLVGAPETAIATNTDHPQRIKPIHLKPAELINRVVFNPTTNPFLPLEIKPQASSSPYYIKLRVEASEALLKNGNGKIYLGLHVDPLYNMEWNNKEDPPKYSIFTPKGVIAPSIKRAPRITAKPSDSEPREFILDARQLNLSKPVSIQIEYYVCSPDRSKREKVSQSYLIRLKPDPYAGKAFLRQIAYKDAISTKKSVSITDIHPDLLKYDRDGDGRLSRNELSGTLYIKFPDIDTNGDDYLSDEEYANYLRTR